MARWRAPSPPPKSAAARNSSPPLERGARPSTEDDWRRCLGRRVSLRYRLHDDPEHPFSEALGSVQSVTSDKERVVVTLVDKRGKTFDIALEDIEAAKVM